MPGKLFNKDEIAQLKRALAQKKTVPQIVRSRTLLPGRTPDSIRQFMRRNKLVDKSRSEAYKSRKKFTEAERIAFAEFLREMGPEHSLQDFVDAWAVLARANNYRFVTRSTVDYWLREKLKAKLSQAEIRNLPRKREANRAHMRNLARKRRDRCDIEMIFLLGELRALREQLRARTKNLVELRCPACREDWPMQEPFYRLRQSRKGLYLHKARCDYCDRKQARLLNALGAKSSEAREERRRSKNQTKQSRPSRLYQEAVARAALKKAEILKANQQVALRSCCVCPNIWPLQAEFFQPNPVREDGTRSYRHVCRFCDRRFAHEKLRRKKNGKATKPVSEELSSALRQARENELRQETLRRDNSLWKRDVKELEACLALESQNGKPVSERSCHTCQKKYPLKKPYFRSTRIEGRWSRDCLACARRRARRAYHDSVKR